MIYGYIRVSTDMQDTENQKIGIIEKASHLNLIIDEWISDDGVSGAKEPEKRLLGNLLGRVQSNDVIIISEISRLGRKLFMIFRILEGLMEKGVKLYSVKDAYVLDNTITSKVLAFAFGMAAEIERDMIQKRTKEGLARRKAEGVILGRPAGTQSGTIALKGKEEEIKKYVAAGLGRSHIARIFGVHRATVNRVLKPDDCIANAPPKHISHTSKAFEIFTGERLHELEQMISVEPSATKMAEHFNQKYSMNLTIGSMHKYIADLGLYEQYRSTNDRERKINNINCGQKR